VKFELSHAGGLSGALGALNVEPANIVAEGGSAESRFPETLRLFLGFEFPKHPAVGYEPAGEEEESLG
jgi:hypothetical protein